jgi:putative ABC transport system permease protein
MFRSIVRNPRSYVAAALTLATGIGAVVGMFSVYNALVLDPMRVPRPQELVAITAANPSIPNVPAALSWIRFDNNLRRARAFRNIAAYDLDSASFVAPGQPPEQLAVLRVSQQFFDVLEIQPQLGRTFTPDEDLPNGPDVCILSHEMWQSRFGGRAMVGTTLNLNGRAVEVVGILPARFTQPWSGQQLFVPRLFETSTLLPENVQGGSSYLSVIARLSPAISVQQAQAELDGLAADYAVSFAGRTDAANGTAVAPFLEGLVAGQRQTLGILLGAVAAVLLVACANASTLFLGRLLSRQRETAVRQGLGASRARIVRQFLLESLGLTLVAGVLGIAIAWGILRAVTVWLGAAQPAPTVLAIDERALGVAALTVIATAVLVGLLPAMYVTRPAMTPLATFGRGASTTPSARRVRALLVVGEVALSCLLLIGAALLIASLFRLQRANPGFDVHGTAAGLVTLSQDRYPTPERQAAFATDAVDRLLQVPGVLGAAAVFGLPLGDEFSFHQYVVAGRPVPPPSERQRAGIRLVTEGYFDLMRIHLKSGRLFSARDRQGAPQVCIVNEAFARRNFDGNPIGQSILRGREANLRYEIVGVVGDVWTYGLQTPVVEEVFYPLRQLPWPQFALIVRADGDASALRRTLEGAASAVDPTQPLASFATMAHRLDQTWGAERTMASLTMAFAAIALLMALVGLYAVLAQSVASRAAEIGVRVALGAGRHQVVRLVLAYGMGIVVSGIAVGLVAAAGAGSFLSARLYGVDARDPWLFGGVALLFTLVALAACAGPSLKAANLDPVRALRSV